MLDNKPIVVEKVAVVDVETTGLSPKFHEVIEIGCILFEQPRVGGRINEIKIIEEWDCKLSPERIEVADPVALKINGYGESRWHESLEQKKGLEIFLKKTTELTPDPFNENKSINSIVILGHNIFFDLRMLEASYERQGMDYILNKRVIDTYSFARAVFRDDASQNNFSLPALCDKFGIVNKNAHSALSDCRATLELYQRLVGVS